MINDCEMSTCWSPFHKQRNKSHITKHNYNKQVLFQQHFLFLWGCLTLGSMLKVSRCVSVQPCEISRGSTPLKLLSTALITVKSASSTFSLVFAETLKLSEWGILYSRRKASTASCLVDCSSKSLLFPQREKTIFSGHLLFVLASFSQSLRQYRVSSASRSYTRITAWQ